MSTFQTKGSRTSCTDVILHRIVAIGIGDWLWNIHKFNNSTIVAYRCKFIRINIIISKYLNFIHLITIAYASFIRIKCVLNFCHWHFGMHFAENSTSHLIQNGCWKVHFSPRFNVDHLKGIYFQCHDLLMHFFFFSQAEPLKIESKLKIDAKCAQCAYQYDLRAYQYRIWAATRIEWISIAESLIQFALFHVSRSFCSKCSNSISIHPIIPSKNSWRFKIPLNLWLNCIGCNVQMLWIISWYLNTLIGWSGDLRQKTIFWLNGFMMEYWSVAIACSFEWINK